QLEEISLDARGRKALLKGPANAILVDVAKLEPITRFGPYKGISSEAGLLDVDLSRDASRIAIAAEGRPLEIIDPSTSKAVRELPESAAVAFDDTGAFVARALRIGSPPSIEVFRLAYGEKISVAEI